MVNRRNYYRILHVQPDAPIEIIRLSYRTLMQRLKMHPDLGGDHWNASLINEAYRVLTSSSTREKYDRDQDLLRRGGEKDAAANGDTPFEPGRTEQAESPEPNQESSGPDTGNTQSADDAGHWTRCLCLFCLHPTDELRSRDPAAVCPQCASPLFRIEHLRYEEIGQRAVRRIEQNIAIQVYTTWPQATGVRALTEDTSPNGIRFQTAQPIAEDQRVKIKSEKFDAVAWVTHCQPLTAADSVRWAIGVGFETLIFHHAKGSFISISA